MAENTHPEKAEGAEGLLVKRDQLQNIIASTKVVWWALILGALLGMSVVGCIATAFLQLKFTSADDLMTLLPYLLAGFTVGVVVYILAVYRYKSIQESEQRRVDYELAVSKLRDRINEDFFTKLVQINFKYLDQYYMQTQEQAAKSFKLTLFASIAGLLLLLFGILLMFVKPIDPGYVTVGTGALTEIISGVFFYLYNRTIQEMSQYHQKLVITQNISLALKISEGLPESEKAGVQKDIISRITENVSGYLAGRGNAIGPA